MYNRWLVIEHELRFMTNDYNLDIKDFYQVDNLKTAIIALMGIKLNWDNNEIFKENMLQQVKKSIEYLNNIGMNLKKIQEFVDKELS